MISKNIYKKMAMLADYLNVDIDEIDIGNYKNFFNYGRNEYEVFDSQEELFDTAIDIERDLIYDNLFNFEPEDSKEFIESRNIKDIINYILKFKNSDNRPNDLLGNAIMVYLHDNYTDEHKLFKLASKIQKINFDEIDDLDDDEFYEYLQNIVYDYFWNKYKDKPVQFFLDNNMSLKGYLNEDDIIEIAKISVEDDGPESWFDDVKHFTWTDGKEYIINEPYYNRL